MKSKFRRSLVGVAGLSATLLLAGCSNLHSAMYTTHQAPPPPAQVTPATTYPSLSETPSSGSGSSSRAATASAKCYPTRMKISSLGINESIIPYGLSEDVSGGTKQKVLEPPPSQTVWYNGSVIPGQKGVSLIAGHVTYYGPSVFYKLGDITKGATIRVSCNDDSVLPLQVTATASLNKDAAMTDQRIWGPSATPVVAFVTCDIKSPMIGGHHTNNFVVWTKPIKTN